MKFLIYYLEQLIMNDLAIIDVSSSLIILNAALRGAAILRARQQKGHQTSAFTPAEEQIGHGQEPDISSALHFVSEGGELMKRTRKGMLPLSTFPTSCQAAHQLLSKNEPVDAVEYYTEQCQCNDGCHRNTQYNITLINHIKIL